MRAKSLSVWLTLTTAVAVGGILACSSYEFTPITPVALVERNDVYSLGGTANHPDIMLLVDRSGSMGTVDVSGQPNRLQQVKSTMQTFLGNNGTVARFGMVAFASLSNTGSCVPAQVADIASTGVDIPKADDDATLNAAAAAANSKIQGLNAGGSTPTAESLSNLASYAPLQADTDRGRYVLLMTDGEPNCNSNNPNNSCTASNSLCRCTSNKCTVGGSQCSLDCLDDDRSVQSVTSLRNSGIKTIVIGFGADTLAGDAPATLNSMALAGGFERTCPGGTNAECNQNDASDGCDLATHTCLKRYYQAKNGTELAEALAAILGRIPKSCKWTLTQIPQDPRFLSVTINGTTVPPGPDSWTYDSSTGQVVFNPAGAACKQIEGSSPTNPVNLEFHILNHL